MATYVYLNKSQCKLNFVIPDSGLNIFFIYNRIKYCNTQEQIFFYGRVCRISLTIKEIKHCYSSEIIETVKESPSNSLRKTFSSKCSIKFVFLVSYWLSCYNTHSCGDIFSACFNSLFVNLIEIVGRKEGKICVYKIRISFAV